MARIFIVLYAPAEEIGWRGLLCQWRAKLGEPQGFQGKDTCFSPISPSENRFFGNIRSRMAKDPQKPTGGYAIFPAHSKPAKLAGRFLIKGDIFRK